MYHYGLKCTDSTSLSDEYELVIVPVPVNHLEDALVDLAPRSPESTFLIFSGNWDGTEGIDRILPGIATSWDMLMAAEPSETGYTGPILLRRYTLVQKKEWHPKS